MNECILKKQKISLSVLYDNNSAYIGGGKFGKLLADKSDIVKLRIKQISTASTHIVGGSDFSEVNVRYTDNHITIDYYKPRGFDNFRVRVIGVISDSSVTWETFVMNDNIDITVESAFYPSVTIINKKLDMFLPLYSGIVCEDIQSEAFNKHYTYCGWDLCMQYFSFMSQNDGLYIATHDADAAVKHFDISSDTGQCKLECEYPGENIGSSANSFKLAGKMVWQVFEGDWYDAAMIYRDFVISQSNWLPDIDKNGRIGTPKWFVDVPFWIMDWVPNTEQGGDGIPTSVCPNGEVSPDDWYELPIKLQKELGVPIGYHIYNWHKIPFNNDYPHFLPAKAGFREKVKLLQDNNIHCMPYINARLWDIRDKENEDFSFTKEAYASAIKKSDGSLDIRSFESHEKDGSLCELAMMCPSTAVWKNKISEVVKKIEYDIGADAVYLDQISGSLPILCFDKNHNHLPGGGKWWMKEYELTLQRFNAERRENNAYVVECNAECYMKGVDGFLTWIWLHSNQVPAFSAVYAGFVTMLGRNTNGKKKNDVLFFKANTAQSLLYGQQLGWCNADVVNDKSKFEFLKKMVLLRYENSELFSKGRLLRPPVVKSDIADEVTGPAMSFTDDYVIRHVMSGAWRTKEGLVKIFVTNIADIEAHFEIKFSQSEYGGIPYDTTNLDIVQNGDTVTVSGKIDANDYVVITI